MSDQIKVIDCEDADELIGRLRLSDEHWNGVAQPGSWIFRGQSDAEWGLRPTAFRKDWRAHFTYLNSVHGGQAKERPKPRAKTRKEHYSDQLTDELNAVAEFVNLADEVGLVVPTDVHSIRSVRHQFEHLELGERSKRWPPDALISTFALAQHHGIPTRLLDFSRDPLVALFFAAYGVFREHGSAALELDGDLAVWALNTEIVENMENIDEDATEKEDFLRFEIVTAAGHQNRFLHRQKGVFLHHAWANRVFLETGAWEPFEEGLLRSLKSDGGHTGSILKFTLPAYEAEEVLEKLAYEHYTLAHLMPSLNNVAEALRLYGKLYLAFDSQ